MWARDRSQATTTFPAARRSPVSSLTPETPEDPASTLTARTPYRRRAPAFSASAARASGMACIPPTRGKKTPPTVSMWAMTA